MTKTKKQNILKKEVIFIKYILEIDERPIPKERPRHSKYFTKVYTPTKTKNFERFVGYWWHLKRFPKLEGALKVTVKFYYKKPKDFEKRKNKFCVKRPDIDNLVKSIFDGLNEVAFKDDAQIVDLSATKNYGDEDKIIIEIEELKNAI